MLTGSAPLKVVEEVERYKVFAIGIVLVDTKTAQSIPRLLLDFVSYTANALLKVVKT
jgi:hypothetical protein